MLNKSDTFSSYSVDDLDQARTFYKDILGLVVKEIPMGPVELHMDNGSRIFIYPKTNHEPATFTVLNFAVNDIDRAVDELAGHGVKMERYEGLIPTDEKGIHRGQGSDPSIAWFKDPAGNILSVIKVQPN